MLFYIYAVLLIIPLMASFAPALRRGYDVYITSAAINVLASFEVLVNCLTGFSNNKYYRDIRLNPMEIFVNYLKGAFLIDFVFVFPLSLYAKVFMRDESERWKLIARDIVSWLLILKLISVRLIWSYLMNIFEVRW